MKSPGKIFISCRDRQTDCHLRSFAREIRIGSKPTVMTFSYLSSLCRLTFKKVVKMDNISVVTNILKLKSKHNFKSSKRIRSIFWIRHWPQLMKYSKIVAQQVAFLSKNLIPEITTSKWSEPTKKVAHLVNSKRIWSALLNTTNPTSAPTPATQLSYKIEGSMAEPNSWLRIVGADNMSSSITR